MFIIFVLFIRKLNAQHKKGENLFKNWKIILFSHETQTHCICSKRKKFFKDNENTKKYKSIYVCQIFHSHDRRQLYQVEPFCFSFILNYYLFCCTSIMPTIGTGFSLKNVKVSQNQQIYLKGNYLSYHSVQELLVKLLKRLVFSI